MSAGMRQVQRGLILLVAAALALPPLVTAQDVNLPPPPSQVQPAQPQGTQTLPDLTVQDIWSDPYEPDSAHVFRLCADIENVGDSQPPNGFDVSFKLDNEEFYVKHYDQFPKNGDRPCGNMTADVGWHTYNVTVDPDHSVTEQSYDNNAQTLPLHVKEPGQPDLTIYKFDVTPDPPRRGEPLLFAVKVANIGNADSPAFHVAFTYDGKRVGLGSSLPLPPGYYQVLFEQLDADYVKEGNHTFGVIADALSEVNESNEANNEASKTLYFPRLPKPDLIVTNVTWPGAPALRDGQVVNLTARIENVGDVGAGAFSVRMTDTFGASTNPIAAPRLASLAGDSSVNVTVRWFARGAGNHTVKVEADSAKEVAEINESNNLFVDPLFVQPKSGDAFLPDLVPTRLLIQPDPARPGAWANLTAVIQNRGAVRGPAFNVTFLVDGARISEFRTSPLPAGAVVAATARWRAVEGVHRLTVIADRPGLVKESNESNNVLNLSIDVRNLAPPRPSPQPSNETNATLPTLSTNATNQSAPPPKPGVPHLVAPEVRAFQDSTTGRHWLAAKVTNTGGAVADAFTADFFDGAQYVGSANWSSLRPGNSTVLSVTWTNPTGGHHALKVFVHAKDDPSDPAGTSGVGAVDVPSTAKSSLPAASAPLVVASLAGVAMLVSRRRRRD
ncbi:MAG: CARDB domain-containing protein [Thermoplasmatota archaeon]